MSMVFALLSPSILIVVYEIGCGYVMLCMCFVIRRSALSIGRMQKWFISWHLEMSNVFDHGVIERVIVRHEGRRGAGESSN